MASRLILFEMELGFSSNIEGLYINLPVLAWVNIVYSGRKPTVTVPLPAYFIKV